MVEEVTVESLITVLVVFGSLVVDGEASERETSVLDGFTVSVAEPGHVRTPWTRVASPQ